MLNQLKIDFIESLNILHKLAKNGSESLPNELCRFLKNELNLEEVFISQDKSENEFVVLGKSFPDHKYGSILEHKVHNFEEIKKAIEFENELILECTVSNQIDIQNLDTFFINLGQNYRFICGIVHKFQPANTEKEKLTELMKFIQVKLSIWKIIKYDSKGDNIFELNEIIDKTVNGLIREIKTNNGLITLVKEERLSIEVQNYIDEIRIQNLKVLNSINDLMTLISLDKINKSNSTTEIDFSEILRNIKREFNSFQSDIDIQIDNRIQSKFYFDEEIIKPLIEHILKFLGSINGIKNISFKCHLADNYKMRLSFCIKSLKLSDEKLSFLSEPFETSDLTGQVSGLSLTLIAKYVQILGGSLKFLDDHHEFKVNITLPVKIQDRVEFKEQENVFTSENKDKVLVVESDSASSLLLRNHLKKWDYTTDIVNTGRQAIRKLNENKYVAVILNIEQEEENSLLILQQIKNNKVTRNTPVIVFTVEADKDKIYLMGSVDYLIKPINYNHLVEILTSYKLRRNSTVLCVDDDKPTLNLLQQAVQTSGFNVIAFHRPEFVMDEIIEKDIDLAIIDLDMPVLNGFELIKKIKSLEKFSKLPIIIYTGQEDYHNDLEKIDGMFVDLLYKRSTSFNDLENTISDMIKSYEEPLKGEIDMENISGPKILMAEDYKHSQIIVTRLLKKSGFENVIVVENGEEALNICENDKIDLILMDMQMPIMNGFEATGKIRELPGYSETPIISLTAFAMKGDREKCLEAGATDYIPKPIDSKEFIEKVKYYTQVTVTE